VIGTSMGGLRALRAVLAGLPRAYGGSVFIVQHVAPDRRGRLAALLQNCTALPVEAVEEPAPIAAGHVYVAAPDRHMVVWDDHVLPTVEPRENRTRPAINPLFRTAAASRGSRTIGVLLTGRLDDGVVRCARVDARIANIRRELVRNLLRSDDAIHDARRDRAQRHPVELRRTRILHEHEAAALLDRCHAERAVAADSGQNHSDGAVALIVRKRAQK
jgi:hypothetical protein